VKVVPKRVGEILSFLRDWGSARYILRFRGLGQTLIRLVEDVN
jgi:hypothetical protein